jgi:hypothetical protein
MRKWPLFSLLALALAPALVLSRSGPPVSAEVLSPDAAAMTSALLAASKRASSEQPDDLGPPLHDTHRTTLAASMPVKMFGGIPWAPPGPQHPRGTILLAYSDRASGPRVVEWDLARDAAVRSLSLGLSTSSVDVSIARAGESCVVVSSAPGGAVFVSLVSPALEMRPAIEIGRGSGAVVAASGSRVAVAWLDAAGKAISLATMDAREGAVRARGSLPVGKPCEAASFPVGQLLLVQGEVWLRDYPGWGLSAFSPDLVPRRRQEPFEGELFLREGVAWSIHRRGTVVALFEVGSDLAEQARGEVPWGGAYPFISAAHDPRAGLGFSGGYVMEPSGKMVNFAAFSMIPYVFWAHGHLVGLAPGEDEGYTQVAWAGEDRAPGSGGTGQEPGGDGRP